jgi:intracellular sulfur oxidation DsrE/DsrF family protein
MIKLFYSLMLVALFNFAHAQDIKVVYHVNNGIDTAAATLNNIQNHLSADPKAKIVVVTHGPGIDFLLQDAKDSKGREFSAAVSDLAGKGVDFRVCNNTLVSRNIDPDKLLMETKIVPSGVAEVARLQAKEGYVYLKP